MVLNTHRQCQTLKRLIAGYSSVANKNDYWPEMFVNSAVLSSPRFGAVNGFPIHRQKRHAPICSRRSWKTFLHNNFHLLLGEHLSPCFYHSKWRKLLIRIANDIHECLLERAGLFEGWGVKRGILVWQVHLCNSLKLKS